MSVMIRSTSSTSRTASSIRSARPRSISAGVAPGYATLISTRLGRDSGNMSRTSVSAPYTPPTRIAIFTIPAITGFSTPKRASDLTDWLPRWRPGGWRRPR